MRNWTEEREQAAELIAKDELSLKEVSVKLRVNPRTLIRWNKVPEFIARVKKIVGAYQAKALRHTIADKDRRVGVLNQMWEEPAEDEGRARGSRPFTDLYRSSPIRQRALCTESCIKGKSAGICRRSAPTQGVYFAAQSTIAVEAQLGIPLAPE